MLVPEPDEVTLAVSVGAADGSAVEVGVLSSTTLDAGPEPVPVPEPESDEL
jgi:hypothetical protein